MDRLARLYAVAETLRAAAPRLVTVADLAARHDVSTRTMQRDLQALMASGLPVRWEEGRGGGWTVETAMSLPPINLTADEAAAVLLAVRATCGAGPLADAAQRAWAKISAVVGAEGAAGIDAWDELVAVKPAELAVRSAVETGVRDSRLLHVGYRDASGEVTSRDVEPIGLLVASGQWYLIGWCRLRRATRAFRFDRFVAAQVADEVVVHRDLEATLRREGVDIAGGSGVARRRSTRVEEGPGQR